ncbi:exonuclease SbcCD subunit D [Chloroflexota bacterium]
MMLNGTRMQRRMLHTSDLHLASLGDVGCRSLEAMVDLAIRNKVDLVMIAGDLFDHNRVDDNLVGFVVQQLQRLPVYVAVLPGNHDCLVRDSVFFRDGLWRNATNIQIFRKPEGETLSFHGLGVSVWGKPIVSHENDFRPLVGIPQHQCRGEWHITMAHGYYVGTDIYSYRAFQISQQEIVNSGQDYIALGHSPSFRCVCNEPVTCYCDSPSLFGTVAIVDLTEERGVQVSRDSLWNE